MAYWEGGFILEYLRQKRIVQMFYLILLLIMPLLVHLWHIQIVDGPEYAQKALDQQTLKVGLEDVPRGQILDRNGKSLTGNRQEVRVIVFPELIKDKGAMAGRLAEILHVDRSAVMGLLEGQPRYLPYQVDNKQVGSIRALNQLGVQVGQVNFRYGPDYLAPQLVGYLGNITSQAELANLNQKGSKSYNFGDLVGQMGLEQLYEEQLKGTASQHNVRAYMDVYNNLIKGLGVKNENDGVDLTRENVVTTIDADMQRKVEAIVKGKIKKGAVVVMDAHNGDILAMASQPDFDPTKPAASVTGAGDAFLERATSLYQPGSVFKIVTAAAALEEKLVQPDSTFVCLGDKDPLVHCWKPEGHGLETFEQAFAQSCNPAFAQIGLRVGAPKLIEYARKLGLDNQNIIGYPYHQDSRQKLNLIGRPNSLVNSSIGQGPVLATPVQITAMVNTIVNNGVYMPPRLVRGLADEEGNTVKSFPVGKSRKVLSSDTAKEIQKLMHLVTTEGVGKDGLVPFYGSAGKTGSAEVGKNRSTVNAWFAGYAPLEQPRYVVTVMIENGISGDISAAPIFKQIMLDLLA